MRILWTGGWTSTAPNLVLLAWMVVAAYFLVSALFTNRIKSHEVPRNRLVDLTLLVGGYFFLFSQGPFLGSLQRHYLPRKTFVLAAGVLLAYVGAPLILWSRICLGRYWSSVVALKEDHKLIQSGPYRWVRHPLYTGIILAALGLSLSVTTWNSLIGALLLTTCFERRAHKEDTLLATEFGAEFEAYRQRTGRLVPRVS